MSKVHKYKEDTTYLESVTYKLGNNQTSYLEIYHDSNILTYDIVRVTFFTNKDVEDFSQSVKQLEFKLLNKYGSLEDNNFLDKVNRENQDAEKTTTNKRLLLAQRAETEKIYARWELYPMVTRWDLSDGQKSITIEYADTNRRGDVWLYGQTPLDGNIIVVTLNRR